jgi:hypothetical protein
MQTKKMAEFSLCTAIMSASGILVKVQNLETTCDDALTSTQY